MRLFCIEFEDFKIRLGLFWMMSARACLQVLQVMDCGLQLSCSAQRTLSDYEVLILRVLGGLGPAIAFSSITLNPKPKLLACKF